jgi:nicotinamide mononucleotide transporter
MYTFYGLFVIYGFTQWVKVTRQASAHPEGADQPARVG